MATRLPASERTREGLTTLVEGRLSTASPKDELVKPLVEEALGGEATDAVGRPYWTPLGQQGQNLQFAGLAARVRSRRRCGAARRRPSPYRASRCSR
jgi:hypothetical protein